MYGISPSLKRFRRFTTSLKTLLLQVVLNARTFSLFYQFSIYKGKKRLIANGAFLIIYLFLSHSSLLFAQNCSYDLSVMKNRSIRSISENSDTVFQLLLSNDSSIDQSYALEVIPMNTSCSVESESRSSSNRNIDKINFEFYGNGRRVDQLIVPAFTQMRLELKASGKLGLLTNDWSCFRVIVRNFECDETNYSEEIIKIYTISPNEG